MKIVGLVSSKQEAVELENITKVFVVARHSKRLGFVARHLSDDSKKRNKPKNKDRICPLWKTLPNHDCSECPHADGSCIMINPKRATDYINGN